MFRKFFIILSIFTIVGCTKNETIEPENKMDFNLNNKIVESTLPTNIVVRQNGVIIHQQSSNVDAIIKNQQYPNAKPFVTRNKRVTASNTGVAIYICLKTVDQWLKNPNRPASWYNGTVIYSFNTMNQSLQVAFNIIINGTTYYVQTGQTIPFQTFNYLGQQQQSIIYYPTSLDVVYPPLIPQTRTVDVYSYSFIQNLNVQTSNNPNVQVFNFEVSGYLMTPVTNTIGSTTGTGTSGSTWGF